MVHILLHTCSSFHVPESIMHYTMRYLSPVGPLHLLGDEHHLFGLWIEGQKYFPEGLESLPTAVGRGSILTTACRWLDRYFSGQQPSPFELPLAPPGKRLQATDMEGAVPYSLRRSRHLQSSCRKSRGSHAPQHHVCSGCGGRRRP